MIRDEKSALKLLKKHGALTVVPTGEVPSLVVAVTGGSIRGSWWGHPDGPLIYRILTALDDHQDVLISKVAAGKQTILHRALFPALLRAVTDAAWRSRALKKLGASECALVALAQKEERIRMDEPAIDARLRKARADVEKSLLVHAIAEHTESGKHETVLESWPAWAARAKVKPSAGSFDDAVRTLGEHLPGVPLPF